MVTRHNMIRDILVETCRRAHIGIKVEVGNSLSRDHSKTRPAYILLPNWFVGRTAVLDVFITSQLNRVNLLEAGVLATAAAQALSLGNTTPMTPSAQIKDGYVSLWSLKHMELGEKKPLPLSPL